MNAKLLSAASGHPRGPRDGGDVTRRGRPPVPPEERRDAHRVTVYVTAAELRELRAYAEREGESLAGAIREAALRAARWRP